MSQQLEEKKSFALDDSQIAQAETKLSGNSTTKFYLHLLKGSIVGALGGLLFGFDTAVIAGATHALTTEFSLDAASLGITVSSALWGTVISAMTAGIPGQKYGARDTLRWTAVLYVISAIGCALATNWWALLAFRFIGGLAIGASSVLGPVYIAELAPAAWRGRLVGLFQVNIVIGILLAYLSNFAIATMHTGVLEWRYQLGVSALPALLFLGMLFTIPHGARWLILKGRYSEARAVLAQTSKTNPEAEFDLIMQSINEQSEGEKGLNTAKSEKLFSAKYRLPIFLAITIGMFNQLSGINAVLYYLNDIFAAAGFSKMSGDLQAVAVGATNLLFTLIAMTLIDKLGRKALLLVGSVGMAISLGAIAYIFSAHAYASALIWCLIGFIGFFAISQGAVIWVYLSEVFPTSVRAKGQGLGSSTHWIMNALISGIFPVMAQFSPATPFVFFSAMMALQFVVVLLIYPETKGFSLEQMQKQMVKS